MNFYKWNCQTMYHYDKMSETSIYRGRYLDTINRTKDLIIRRRYFRGLMSDEEIRDVDVKPCWEGLWNDTKGLMVGYNSIFVNPPDDIYDYENKDLIDLVMHELYHIYQMRKWDRIGFTSRYFKGMLQTWGSTGPENPVEKEAYNWVSRKLYWG